MTEISSLPKVSIITITYNAERYLERTIKSIIGQDYPNIEYIIIDGESSDGTLDIIKRYENHITHWQSEADQGIYDAMNKGLTKSSGDYVWFMNAGDQIVAPHTLSQIIATNLQADIYYGEAEFYNLEGKYLGTRSEATPLKLPQHMTWRDLRLGLMVCHQAILVKRDIAPKYNLKHPYSADIDWVIRALKKSQKTVNVKENIAIYLQGGFSRQHLRKSLLDRFVILRQHFGLFPTIFNHFLIVLRSIRYVLTKRKGY